MLLLARLWETFFFAIIINLGIVLWLEGRLILEVPFPFGGILYLGDFIL